MEWMILGYSNLVSCILTARCFDRSDYCQLLFLIIVSLVMGVSWFLVISSVPFPSSIPRCYWFWLFITDFTRQPLKYIIIHRGLFPSMTIKQAITLADFLTKEVLAAIKRRDDLVLDKPQTTLCF